MTEGNPTYHVQDIQVTRYEGVCNTCHWRTPQQTDPTSAHVLVHAHVLQEHPVQKEDQ